MASTIETPPSRRSSTRLHHTRKRVHLEQASCKQRQLRRFGVYGRPGGQSPTACADGRTGRVCVGVELQLSTAQH
eukprot:2524933-Pleurochrysis_carterae.AAC.1